MRDHVVLDHLREHRVGLVWPKVINTVRVCDSRSSYPMKSCRFARLEFPIQGFAGRLKD
jgi:hypothetical protein